MPNGRVVVLNRIATLSHEPNGKYPATSHFNVKGLGFCDVFSLLKCTHVVLRVFDSYSQRDDQCMCYTSSILPELQPELL